MAIKKLVCDRCGKELEGKEVIELALEGSAAWQAWVKERGAEPRGLFPCKNWIQCQGEMIIFTGKESSQGGKTN